MNNGEVSIEAKRAVDYRYSRAIANKAIAAIEADDRMTSCCSLGSRALRDSLPEICQTIIEAVTSSTPEVERHNLSLYTFDREGRGAKHGYVRSMQEFSPQELVREFFLLKRILTEELKPLLLADPKTIIEKLTLMDSVVNRIMENSFQSYAEERKRQFEDLRQQIFLTEQELTRLVAARQQHLSYLVHEFKSPLTSIIGYSDLFLRQQSDDSVTDLRHIRQVLQQGRKLLRLVNDTSEIDPHQQGNFPLQIRELDVCALIESIELGLKPSTEAKQLRLITSCTPRKLIITSDSLRIQQIITNLLINAVRYTHEGQIELTCRVIESEFLEIRVADTGIGISQIEQKRIFEPYFRGQKSQDNAADGVGLGLAVVDKLITALNGKIDLYSEVNVGSIFTVTIPVSL